jgi:Ribbon-helix-helix protein, copG family
METEKTLNGKFAYRSFRLPRQDLDAWKAAAAKLEISQSEFFRQALRDKAHEVLRENREQNAGRLQLQKKGPGATLGQGR